MSTQEDKGAPAPDSPAAIEYIAELLAANSGVR